MATTLRQFFYQDNAAAPVIRRLTGIMLVLISPLGASYFTNADPYLVPSWLLVKPPFFPLVVYLLLWLCCMICGLALALGRRERIWLLLPLVLIGFAGSCEFTCIYCNYYILLWLYLLALLFERQPRSCCRAIIQVSLAACYFFSAAEKLHPEWLSGYSIYQIVHDGWGVRAELVPFIKSLNLSVQSSALMALGTVAAEFFLSFALFLKPLRKPAFALGICFHVICSIIFYGLDLFTPIVFTGYLAFVESKKAKYRGRDRRTIKMKEPLAAALVLLLILFMPLRFITCGNPAEFAKMTFADLSPWGFAMFLQREEACWTRLDCLDKKQKRWRLSIRSNRYLMGADRELLSLARYILDTSPETDKVFLACQIVINRHHCIQKDCTAQRQASGSYVFKLSVHKLM